MLEDLALMRVLPHMKVIVPADAVEAVRRRIATEGGALDPDALEEVYLVFNAFALGTDADHGRMEQSFSPACNRRRVSSVDGRTTG